MTRSIGEVIADIADSATKKPTVTSSRRILANVVLVNTVVLAELSF